MKIIKIFNDSFRIGSINFVCLFCGWMRDSLYDISLFHFGFVYRGIWYCTVRASHAHNGWDYRETCTLSTSKKLDYQSRSMTRRNNQSYFLRVEDAYTNLRESWEYVYCRCDDSRISINEILHIHLGVPPSSSSLLLAPVLQVHTVIRNRLHMLSLIGCGFWSS